MGTAVHDEAALVAGCIAARLRVDSLLEHNQSTPRLYRSVYGDDQIATINREVDDAVPLDVALFNDHSVTRSQFGGLDPAQKRTRVFEAFHRYSTHLDHVCRVVAYYAPGHAVDCSVYEADVSDSPFGRHVDAFHNFVVQLVGAKRWQFNETASTVLQPGDLVFVPYQVSHDVRAATFSRHLSISLVSDAMRSEHSAATA